jgi:hypothetical protein
VHSDPDTLVAVIGEALATVQASRFKAQPTCFRIHPLDVQVLERRYPVDPEKGYTLRDSIKKLMGVPVMEDCGVQRGYPEVDYE